MVSVAQPPFPAAVLWDPSQQHRDAPVPPLSPSSHSRRPGGGAQVQHLPGEEVWPQERNPHLREVRAG